MTALAWWTIPLGATGLAIAWARWISRPRRRVEPVQSVEAYERFRNALRLHEPVP